MGTPTYAAMRERDRQRRRRADDLIVAHTRQDADDSSHAARLSQYGDTSDDAWKSHTLALRGAELGHRPAWWMAATALEAEVNAYEASWLTSGARTAGGSWSASATTSPGDRCEVRMDGGRWQKAYLVGARQKEGFAWRRWSKEGFAWRRWSVDWGSHPEANTRSPRELSTRFEAVDPHVPRSGC